MTYGDKVEYIYEPSLLYKCEAIWHGVVYSVTGWVKMKTIIIGAKSDVNLDDLVELIYESW